jgi:hypothetical protein
MELPADLHWEIMTYLSVKEIFLTAALLNTDFHQASQSLKFLESLVHRDLGVRLHSHDSDTCKAVLRHNSPCFPASQQPLHFYGFATSGAIDAETPELWVRNMFELDDLGYSSDNGSNINCAAVLEATLTRYSVRLEAVAFLRSLEQSLGVQRLPDRSLIDIINSFDKIRVGVWSRLSELLPGYFSHRSALLNLRMIPSLASLTRSEASKLMSEHIDLAEATASPLWGCIHRLKISRQGPYTCPVAALLVLCSPQFLAPDSPEFLKFNDLTTLQQLEQAPSVPSVVNSVVAANYSYCEFKPADSPLQPMLWVKFNPHSEEVVEVTLSTRRLCKFLYTKLVNCEDRMQELGWVHPETNIDICYVVAEGELIAL